VKTMIDPSEARRFANQLAESAAHLRRLNSAVQARLLELHANSWNDARYVEFERRLETASEMIAHFAERSERFADYLRRKAAPVERYLERRY